MTGKEYALWIKMTGFIAREYVLWLKMTGFIARTNQTIGEVRLCPIAWYNYVTL